MDMTEYRRYAGRNEEQFKKDIKDYTSSERLIIDRFAEIYKEKTGKNLHITNNGIDNSGEFIETSKVTDDADFLVNGCPIEVKTIQKNLDIFRLKLYHIKSYVKQGAILLIVLGWKTNTPKFAVLGKKKLEKLIENNHKCIANIWEGKPVVELKRKDYKWHDLNLN